ncbi:MAG: acyltransferase [Nitrospinales bacterium]
MYLRLLGARVGQNVVIHKVRFFNFYRTGFRGLSIDDYCFIGNDVLIDLADEVRLARHVTLAERAVVLTHSNVGFKDHPLQKYYPAHSKPVTIDKGAFVGVNATILTGINIGECAFVSAGSLVNKDIPPYTVVGGVPAKPIKSLR